MNPSNAAEADALESEQAIHIKVEVAVEDMNEESSPRAPYQTGDSCIVKQEYINDAEGETNSLSLELCSRYQILQNYPQQVMTSNSQSHGFTEKDAPDDFPNVQEETPSNIDLSPNCTDGNVQECAYNINHDAFSQAGAIKFPTGTDTVEKPYICFTCDKAFSRAGDLNRHIKTHTGEKPHLCSTCNKTFSRAAHLREHTRSHTGERPYVCTTCDMAFKRTGSLRLHKRIHTGEKPHVCKVCNKAFSLPCNLKQHEKTHTGEKPYVCSTCNKAFSLACNLKQHTKTHTGEKPYVCSTCNKAFSQAGHLRSHMATHA